LRAAQAVVETHPGLPWRLPQPVLVAANVGFVMPRIGLHHYPFGE